MCYELGEGTLALLVKDSLLLYDWMIDSDWLTLTNWHCVYCSLCPVILRLSRMVYDFMATAKYPFSYAGFCFCPTEPFHILSLLGKTRESILRWEYDKTSGNSRQGRGFLGINLADRLGSVLRQNSVAVTIILVRENNCNLQLL